MKLCVTCNRSKWPDAFFPGSGWEDGRFPVCRRCCERLYWDVVKGRVQLETSPRGVCGSNTRELALVALCASQG